MKKVICCFVLLFSVVTLFSQKVYFIYLQSDTEPFFVKMNEQVYTSSGPGYLILSKLRDSAYSFTVGFPGNKWPEQPFKVEIKGKDHGYLLKDFGEKGWGLYDLDNLSVQMAAIQPVKSVSKDAAEVSAFTDILARAANDPSLREKPVAIRQQEQPKQVVQQKEEPKETIPVEAVVKTEVPVKKDDLPVTGKENQKEQSPAEVKSEIVSQVKKDTLVVNKEKSNPAAETVTKADVAIKKEDLPPVKTPDQELEAKKEDTQVVKTEKAEPVKEEAKPVATEEYKPSVIKRRSESSTTEGFGLTFTDEYADGKKDTIRIVIPPSRYVNVVPKDPPKEEKKFLDITTDAKEAPVTKPVAAEKAMDKVTDKVTDKAGPANKCGSMASDNDFLKLRKRMAAQDKDEAMVNEAAKYFKTKCFTVMQVKNLSALFLNDAGKYKFFDVAYSHVSDAENFSSLQAELKDDYYINRFKAMLR